MIIITFIFNKKEMKTVLSCSEKETKEIGVSLGRACLGGEVFCLSGDLGAGKTSLSQGVARGLGIKKIVSSPTFIILNSYKIKNSPKIKFLIHIDAYRLKNTKELEGIGFFDIIKDKKNITIIEWGEKIKKHLPREIIKIKIKILKNSKRKITIF